MNNEQLPFASFEDFEKRAVLENQLNEIEADSNEFWKLEEQYSDFLSTKQWDPYVIEENGKLGIKSVLGEMLLPARYDEISLSSLIISELGVVLARIGQKTGIVKADDTGDVVLPFEYDEIWQFSCSYTAVRKGNKWGYVNYKGEMLSEIIFDEVVSICGDTSTIFFDGLSVFRNGDKYGVINNHDEITEAIFDSISYNGSDTPVIVTQNGKQGYIDSFGRFTEDEEEMYWFAEQ